MVFKFRSKSGFIFLSFLIFVVLTAGLGAYLWSEGVFESEDEQIQKLTAAIIPDNSIVLDRNGAKIGEYFSFYHVHAPFDKIPKPMVQALIAIEDRKFFEHEGVNWKSMARAVLAFVTTGKFRQGGSTITMQLVKNYLLTREKRVSRKLRELILAYYVEKNLSKERILELYLNTMYMGHGAYGVGAASLVYFGKPIESLGIPEFALLAGLFQAPSAYDPHKNPKLAIKRQRVVLDAMLTANFLDKAQTAQFKEAPLKFEPWTPVNETVAPFFVAWIRGEVERLLGNDELTLNDKGYKITTTLDRSMQEIANKSVAEQVPKLLDLQSKLNSHSGRKKPERIEASFFATDSRTGAILALVGGRSFKESQFNRAISAKRSPGSSFKPVVYSLALDRGMSWSDLVYVSPVDVGGFRPQNHKGDEMTEVTLIKALAKSMNTPVISLAQKYGIARVVERAKAMGVTAEMKQETGVAIGGFSCAMPDVNSIYRAIANDGALSDAFAIVKIEDREGKILFQYDANANQPRQILTPAVATLLRSGLQAVLTSGTATSAAHLASFAAGKTGTSDDSRDNWFAGFTRDIVATAWVGGDNFSPLGDSASGASLALPIWRKFIEDVTAANGTPLIWQTPENMAQVTIDPDYGTPSNEGIPALFYKDKVPKQSQATDDMKAIKQDSSNYRELKIGD